LDGGVLLRGRVVASLDKKRMRDQQRELFRKFAMATPSTRDRAVQDARPARARLRRRSRL